MRFRLITLLFVLSIGPILVALFWLSGPESSPLPRPLTKEEEREWLEYAKSQHSPSGQYKRPTPED
jgi:hypothetical protein